MYSLHCDVRQKVNKRETHICRCIEIIIAKRIKYMIGWSSKFTLIRMPPLGVQGSWKELEEDKTLPFTITCHCGCMHFKSCKKSSGSFFFSDLVNSEQGSVLSSLYSYRHSFLGSYFLSCFPHVQPKNENL